MKHKIYITITIAIVIITSCQLLRKEKLTVKEQSQQVQKTIGSSQSKLVLMDSSHNDFAMMLWPKGKFKFNLANGFEGEAEKMMITGKQTHQKTLKVKTMQDSTVLKSSYSNKKESNILVKKNKLSLGWLLAVPLLYLCYWLYKKSKIFLLF